MAKYRILLAYPIDKERGYRVGDTIEADEIQDEDGIYEVGTGHFFEFDQLAEIDDYEWEEY
ncbi:hypothetical protein EG878_14830 [Enterococcus faecalis]|nr:hypothetical protein EG878_14830 [Enterococcus faecalis]